VEDLRPSTMRNLARILQFSRKHILKNLAVLETDYFNRSW